MIEEVGSNVSPAKHSSQVEGVGSSLPFTVMDLRPSFHQPAYTLQAAGHNCHVQRCLSCTTEEESLLGGQQIPLLHQYNYILL